MILYIKNMCCSRCIMAVEDLLRRLSLAPLRVELGEVEFAQKLTEVEVEEIASRLVPLGFELLYSSHAILVEQIRNGVIAWCRKEQPKPLLSDYLQDLCHKEYSSLSKLFSQVRGMTVERYAVLQMVEYAKELITYSELSISEVAYRLGYASLSAFSKQFKKETGFSPRQFQNGQGVKRIPLDKL